MKIRLQLPMILTFLAVCPIATLAQDSPANVLASKPGFLVEAATVDLGNGSKETIGIVLKSGKPKYMKTQ